MPFDRVGGGHDLAAIRDSRRHRLLEEDVLAGFERGDRGLGMLVPHGDDRHRVDLGIGEQVAIVGRRFLHAELGRHSLEPLRRARAERGKLEIRNADDRLAMDLAEPAESDHGNANPVQGLLLRMLALSRALRSPPERVR